MKIDSIETEKSNLKKTHAGLYHPDFEKDACGIGLITSGANGPSRRTIESAMKVLKNLSHRSAQGADGKTSDGAGILLQIPKQFFREQPGLEGLPEGYAVGVLFFAQSNDLSHFEELVIKHGLRVLAWRIVPVDSSVLGIQARNCEPVIRQVFIDREGLDEKSFQRKLFYIQQEAEHQDNYYVASLSQTTMVLKGLVLPQHLGEYFLDLKAENFVSGLALVHSRFSTNTLPAWRLAQPFRVLCHNGEINTIRGNLNWMKAREASMVEQLAPGIETKMLPLFAANRSDSYSLDRAAHLLVEDGRPLPHAMMMLMPEPWDANPHLQPKLKSFYEFHSSRLEPWDGPAAVCFTDGRWIGATLDRNGLRPCRYLILDDNSVILASESGVLNIPEERIVKRGRVKPGQMLAIDTLNNRIYENNEVRLEVAEAWPYAEWVKQEQISLPSISTIMPTTKGTEKPTEKLTAKTTLKSTLKSATEGSVELLKRLMRFGYTYEEIQSVMVPMFRDGEEATSSMGNDTPLALLSDHPQLLFKYFRQMFAQVTNPPIDPIREHLVMSLTTYLGPRADLFSKTSDQLHRLQLRRPILSTAELHGIHHFLENKGQTLRSRTLVMGFDLGPDDSGLNIKSGIDLLCAAAERSALDGIGILILSDRSLNENQLALPALLAVAAVHHHLIRCGLRLKVSILVETAEARDVHHFACLIGYGADAVFPYLALELSTYFEPNLESSHSAEELYLRAINKGLLKIMSKMGISTLQSYCGAQIFEILGLSAKVVEQYFPNTPSRIEGLDLKIISEETLRRYQLADLLAPTAQAFSDLPSFGDIHYRSQGEAHLWTPQAIAKLQEATRTGDAKTFSEFSDEVQRNSRFTLRGHLEFQQNQKSIPLSEVEPVAAILKRFTTGAMSFGALSKEAHETLSIAMNRMGAKSNSGEGGEGSDRFLPMQNGDSKNSTIKQVASGRFGVTAHYLVNATELQIKVAQGAKPGEGGQLPGFKVDATIATLRFSTPGVTLISPPPHHDIYSIEDLSQLIFDLKNSNPEAIISVKLVSEAGVGTIAAGVAKAHAQKVVISGDSGGTGASPLSSIKYAGAPWELGLAETHQTLVRNGLRGRMVIETDGQLKTGRDVAIAALLGAEEFGFSTAPLIVEGCLMMRKCHLNTCPVGVATQDPILRAKFSGQPEHVIQYFHFVAEELRKIMAQLGFRSVLEMVGRNDCLKSNPPADHWKAHSIDLSRLLQPAESMLVDARHFVKSEDRRIEKVLDQSFVLQAKAAFDGSGSVHLTAKVKNTDRAVGTLLSSKVAKLYGAAGLPSDTIQIDLIGTAGQSFGAFLSPGISLRLVGDANDYVGKGLSGGRITIRASDLSYSLNQFENFSEIIIVGNTCLYGATSGEMFIAGAAGERFAVRNSGALAVVEGTGDHGCEYMTSGRVVVLGSTGKNFAAGMSGGIAYVYDEHGSFSTHCNLASVELGPITTLEDREFLLKTLQKHVAATRSLRAIEILNSWKTSMKKFVRVMPIEYKKVLLAQQGGSGKSVLSFKEESLP
jgi:glutamate synthase (NADPH/NADH) large chain